MKKKTLSLALALILALVMVVGPVSPALASVGAYDVVGGSIAVAYDMCDGETFLCAGYYVGDVTEVTFPSDVQGIADEAFRNCTSLTSLTLPDNIIGIGRNAFDGCTGLTSVTIPSSVTNISYYAFHGSGLTTVTISDGVASIGQGAFGACKDLTSVTIPSSVTSIGPFAFDGCTSLTGVTIPSSVTSIGQSAFGTCTSLTSVTIPSSVTSIGQDAFSNCTSLTDITVEAGNPNYTSENGVLFSKDKTELLCWPAGKSVGTYAIPSSVTSISDRAFMNCTGLSGVTIPSGVTSIEEFTFYGTSLTSVTVPSGVTSIDQGVFGRCTGLASVTIPSSVTSIGQSAFWMCNSLTDVYYGGSEAQWSEIAFGNDNGNLLNATIHYNSAVPETPAPAPTARVSAQTVPVDGRPVEFQMYALWDANGGVTNYIKLRDIAYILNGTAAQFEVSWDGTTQSANLLPGQPYTTANGSEMNTPFSGDRAYKPSAAAILINGAAVSLEAITLTDDSGGEYNYYKLRDLGQALNFNVSWVDSQVVVNTDQPYDTN